MCMWQVHAHNAISQLWTAIWYHNPAEGLSTCGNMLCSQHGMSCRSSKTSVPLHSPKAARFDDNFRTMCMASLGAAV
jgi:hypothetical protein